MNDAYRVEMLAPAKEQLSVLRDKVAMSRMKGFFIDSVAEADRRLRESPVG